MILLRPFFIALPTASVVFFLLSQSSAIESAPVHVVKKGETLSQIADYHAVSVKNLQLLNKIKNANRLRIGQRIKLPPKDKPYIVKTGDALCKIAEDHRISVQQMVAYNNLTNPDTLRVGQLLKIPLTSQTYKPAPVLPSRLRKTLAQIKVKKQKWKYIVIHHSASKRGSTAGMDRYHREERHMENGLAYHFVIGNGNGMINGKIDIGDRWRHQIHGGHLASRSLNEKSIGICLVGDFDKERPSKKQMESLQALVTYLMTTCGVTLQHVRTHTEINPKPTRCPGKKFPTSTFKVAISS